MAQERFAPDMLSVFQRRAPNEPCVSEDGGPKCLCRSRSTVAVADYLDATFPRWKSERAPPSPTEKSPMKTSASPTSEKSAGGCFFNARLPPGKIVQSHLFQNLQYFLPISP